MLDLDVRRAGPSRPRRRAGVIAWVTAFLLLAAPAAADTLADRQAEADQVEAELAQLDADLEQAVEAFNAAQIRLDETEAQIAENTRRLEITRGNLTIAQTELNQA